MNLTFRDRYLKLKYFHFITLIAKFRQKYCKSDIFYKLSNVEVVPYLNLKKFHEDMSLTEN